jgi:hypothetical protein
MVHIENLIQQPSHDGAAVARDIARQQASYTAGDNSR